MKKIIITAGPTNERIDAVMKITNMSTGALGAKIAEKILNEKDGEIECLYYLSTKLSRKPDVISDKLKLITIESTDDLLKELERLLSCEKIDAVIHSAAVGDYKGKYCITASMLAEQIMKCFEENNDKNILKEEILELIRNPRQTVSDEHKISSYEADLMFMLDLTPKVIGKIKELSNDTMLIGFKLLDGVSKDELIEVASKLRIKNKADYIIANDLSKIGNGKHVAYFVGNDGIKFSCETKSEIAENILKIVFK